MSLLAKIRRGEGPFYGGLKRAARAVLTFRIPVIRPLWRALYLGWVALVGAGRLLLKILVIEPVLRSIAQVGPRLWIERLPFIAGRGEVVIGSDVEISGKIDIIFGNRHRDAPRLEISDSTFVGHGCSFAIADSVTVGAHCYLAGGVAIRDNDGHPLDALARRAKRAVAREDVRPVTIEDDAWIGDHALVLKGVRVGRGAIVAARAVVTRDVAPFTVVAGQPARVVRELASPFPVEPPDRASGAQR